MRAGAVTVCGGPCREFIRKGDPMLVLEVPGLERTFRRCVRCAGEAPPDLPPLVEQAPLRPTVKLPKRLGGIVLPFDFKAAQIAREPGEEG